jgi:hypothetical protein
MAQLLDFVCCVREIRVAIWLPTSNKVTVIPFTQPPSPSPSQPPPIIQLNAVSGKLLLNSRGSALVSSDDWQSLYLSVKEFDWVPPMSAPSIGAQTIEQIQSQLKLLSPMSEIATAVKKENRSTLWIRLMWLTFVSPKMSTATLVSD